MVDDFPSPLSLSTTEELTQELIRRHDGEGRAIWISTLSPNDGKAGTEADIRLAFIASDPKLLSALVEHSMFMFINEVTK